MNRFVPVLPLLLAVAGGCRDDPPTTPALTASFTVSAAPQAGQPVRFDAAGSVDPGGGGLSYGWSFGDGTVGGTRELAHFYPQAGAYTVTLTVRDATGATASGSQVVSVAAGPAATGSAAVTGRVTLADGTPLSGVAARVEGQAGTVNTAPDGTLTLAGVPVGVPAVVRLERAGHVPGVVRLELPAGATQGHFEAVLVPLRAPVTVPAIQSGGTAAGPDGARVQFPAGAVVDAAGNAVSGALLVTMTPIDLRTEAAAFPGEFAGVPSTGPKAPIASYGLVDVILTSGGQPARVAPGRTVTLDIPIYGGPAAVGQTIPLWSLNEAVGTWVQEGTGTVVASPGSPTGLVLRGEVGHFTPWNVDATVPVGFVQPHCFLQPPSGPPVPLTIPCWAFVVGNSAATGWMGGGRTVQPGQTVGIAVVGGSSNKVRATAPGGLYGESAVVTVATGATVAVNIVLGIAAPPVDMVAVGGDGASTIQPYDGSAWLAVSSPFDGTGGSGDAVAWNGSVWVAGGKGAGSVLATSVDGVAWTPSPSGAAVFNRVSGVAANGSMWVAVGAGPSGFALATSPDGQTWTARVVPPAAGSGLAVAWNGAYWVAGGQALGGVLTSPDGVTWTLRPTAFGGAAVRAVAWNGSVWLAAAGNQLATSSDGITWTTQPSPTPTPRAVAWNGAQWAVGGDQDVAFGDGTTWSTSTIMTFTIYGLAWTGTQWVAIGTPPFPGAMVQRFHGFGWTGETLAFPTIGRAIAARRPLYPPL
jgi:PKD repeat protein